MEKVYMQITSGRGPAECCRVVALVLEKILKQAAAKGVKTEIVELQYLIFEKSNKDENEKKS